ncbi:hypothetical protein HWQ46_25360 [Shewanella sp. D64]|uniref:hypothetical protein n=1 Tax=unclassified Shewanella TaxID=196818 RepID=UPI0022BA6382|nr:MULTISPECIES: hypothetical protein [unclassified Shewanella]MEC4728847.1 hypothetical protein [Shewanella sp. D64]MEC4740721.1 hypothetical protein [Shewanella sp. E94]WBJ95320.1 hypothetical protein HWQ47_26625 [Shewanella sp. MTB7]
MIPLKVWGAALLVMLLCVFAYDRGVSVTEQEHALKQAEQTRLLNLEREELNKAIRAANARTAEKVIEVQTQFVPIEKEVIRYVETIKPATNPDCQPDHTQWMQLHNRAATARSY